MIPKTPRVAARLTLSLGARVAAVALSATAALAALAAHAAELHVDAAATAGGDGTVRRPFRRIQEAADAARPGDVVLVHAGTYRETVVPARSGTADAPIVYRPFRKDVVTLSGADPVTGWSPDAQSGVHAAALPADWHRSANGQALQVFVDGRMVNLARWPNTSLDVSRPAKAATTRFVSKTRDGQTRWTTGVMEDPAVANIGADITGAEIVFQPNDRAWSWTVSGVVTGRDGDNLSFRTRNDAGKDGEGHRYHDKSRYYLHNLRALLDAPGEWYHDASANRLFLMTPERDDPAGHTVEAKRRDWAFDLSDRGHIRVENFKLFACAITTDRDSGGDGRPYDAQGNERYPWRGKNNTAPAHHLTLDGLDGRYLSHFTDMSGHFFLQWGQSTGIVASGTDITVKNCRLRYSAGNGITLLGRGNKALNNLIEDASYQQVDGAGIATGGAADTFDHEIGFNTVRFTGRSGILPRNLQNSDPSNLRARIHHNDVSRVMLQDWDGGCIYGVGDGKFVRIDHNWCHDAEGFGVSGVYPDILTNWIVDHNVIWNLEWGIKLQNNGRPEGNALCYNNTILVRNTSGTPYGPFGFANNASNKGKGDVIANNLIGCLNPAEAKGYKPIEPNFGDAEIGVNVFLETAPTLPPDADGWTVATLAARAAGAEKRGKAVGTLVRDGVTLAAQHDPFTGSAPPVGAIEPGAARWTAGATLTPEPVGRIAAPRSVKTGTEKATPAKRPAKARRVPRR